MDGNSGITAAGVFSALTAALGWIAKRYIERIEKERDAYRDLIDKQMADKETRLVAQAKEVEGLRLEVRKLEAEVRRLERKLFRGAGHQETGT